MVHALFLMVVQASTPELSVSKFVDAINAGRFDLAMTMVAGGKPSNTSMLKAAGLKIEKFKCITKVSGTSAIASVTYEYRAGNGGAATAAEKLKLVKTNNKWLISPEKSFRRGNDHLLGDVATLLSSGGFEAAKQAALHTVLLSNLKQVSVGIQMYLADNDDILSLTDANLKAKLMPYLKNNKLFESPLLKGKSLVFTLNPNLVGKPVAKIANPAKTVMIVVGERGKPTPIEGEAYVGFADGHCAKMPWAKVKSLKY